MSLRMVAGETPRSCRSARALLPTGSLVETKSWTIARRTCRRRSSCATVTPPRTGPTRLWTECEIWHSPGTSASPAYDRPVVASRFTAGRRPDERERLVGPAVRVGPDGGPGTGQDSGGRSPDLQSGTRGPSLSRSRHDHPGLGADPPTAGPHGHAGHDEAGAGARRPARRRLHLLRR